MRMLIAYEDRRFYEHYGIDPLAIGRAGLQLVTNGRIVSGASTLSMQVARLIEPRAGRSLSAKILQVIRAVQIERRLSKEEILDLYLTHAPYGGNLEGVRAASLAYFGKEPKRLTVAQSALLVALPQLPERRRPDKNLAAAEAARKRVLKRSAVAEVIGEGEAERAEATLVPATRMQLPALAAHLAEAALRSKPNEREHRTTLKKQIQAGLEATAKSAAMKLRPKLSLAIVMADARTGEIVGEVGSADYFDASRSGWIDMTRVSRSPGSTLKPFIYGLAFEQGLVQPGNDHRGPASRFLRLPAAQFRHELSRRRNGPRGIAAFVECAGRQAALTPSNPARGSWCASAAPAFVPSCRRTRRRDWRLGSAA